MDNTITMTVTCDEFHLILDQVASSANDNTASKQLLTKLHTIMKQDTDKRLADCTRMIIKINKDKTNTTLEDLEGKSSPEPEQTHSASEHDAMILAARRAFDSMLATDGEDASSNEEWAKIWKECLRLRKVGHDKRQFVKGIAVAQHELLKERALKR
jgi:hypothetical protein